MCVTLDHNFKLRLHLCPLLQRSWFPAGKGWGGELDIKITTTM